MHSSGMNWEKTRPKPVLYLECSRRGNHSTKNLPKSGESMDRLYLDTNVLLDVLEKRKPWFPESSACLSRVESGRCKGAVSAITLSDISYIQKGTATEVLYGAFCKLRSFLAVAPIDQRVVDSALARALPDMEDGFQLEAALSWRATHLITRNERHFPSAPGLLVMSPARYLSR